MSRAVLLPLVTAGQAGILVAVLIGSSSVPGMPAMSPDQLVSGLPPADCLTTTGGWAPSVPLPGIALCPAGWGRGWGEHQKQRPPLGRGTPLSPGI